MDQSEHLAKLEDHRQGSLYKGLSKYQHIERLGHPDVEGLLDGTCYIQTKIDGANLTVARDAEEGLIIASRNQAVSVGGNPSQGFRGAIEYITRHMGIIGLLYKHPKLILRGEWLVHHSLVYNKDAYNKFYVFDIQFLDSQLLAPNTYLKPAEVVKFCQDFDINYIGYNVFENPTKEKLESILKEECEFGAKYKEGIVIKREGFVNKWGRAVWAKMVNEGFKTDNKLAFGASKKDDVELQFASKVVTLTFVYKIIDKIQDTKGEVPVITDMQEILGRAWHEALTEELPDYVSKKKVKEFNFGTARRLVEQRTRTIALERFNMPLEENK